MVKESIKKAYEERIASGLSKYIPGRSRKTHSYDGYCFFPGSCTIYFTNEQRFEEIPEHIFDEMLRSYWREEKNDKKHERKICSVYDFFDDDPRDTLYDITPDPNAAIPECEYLVKERSTALRDCVSHLTPARQDIINGIYFGQKTEKEVAAERGTSQSCVNIIKQSALRELAKEYEDMEVEFEL